MRYSITALPETSDAIALNNIAQNTNNSTEGLENFMNLLKVSELVNNVSIPSLQTENVQLMNTQLMHDQLAFNSMIIELYEKNQVNFSFCEEKNKLILENIANDLDKSLDLHSEPITSILLTTQQPFIVFPTYSQEYVEQDIQVNINGLHSRVNTLFLIDQDHHKFNDDVLVQNIVETMSGLSSENEMTLQAHKIDYFLPQPIYHECNQCEFTITQQAGIEQYKSMSSAVQSQVLHQIKLHSFAEQDSLEVELYPAKLGKIKIKCETKDKIVIHVFAEKLTTLALLQENAHELKNALKNNLQGSSETELQFNMNSDDSNSQHQKDHSNNSRTILHQTNDTSKESLVYFYHNGIVNFFI